MILHAKPLRPAVRRLSLLIIFAALTGSLCLGSTAADTVALQVLDISASTLHPCGGQLSILVEGDGAHLIDSHGKNATPLQYKDTVYIPAATAAEWLGKTLQWDESSQILHLNGHVPPVVRRESAGGGDASGLASSSAVKLLPNSTVKLDGTAIRFTDANGNEVFPVLYRDSVYLPLRSIGELCGYQVTWYQTSGDCAYVFLRTPLTATQQQSAESYVNSIQQNASTFSAQVTQMIQFLRQVYHNTSLSQDQALQLEGYIADLLVSLDRLENLDAPQLPLLESCPQTAYLQEDARQATATLQSALSHLRAGADLDHYLGLLWGNMPTPEGDGIICGMDSYAVFFTAYGSILHRIVFQTD